MEYLGGLASPRPPYFRLCEYKLKSKNVSSILTLFQIYCNFVDFTRYQYGFNRVPNLDKVILLF